MKIVASFLLVLSIVFAVSISAMAEDADHAPDTYKVLFETSKGDFTVQVHREWAPNGADRFFKLVESGYYDECRFFRVIPGFMVQWGINGDPEIQKNWVKATIKDDRVTKSNTRGFITFATSGRNSRTSQLFINYGDNARLDRDGFSPFGQVTEGMDVVDAINAQYREQPDQGQIQERGNKYLNQSFPKLDYIKKATVVKQVEPAESLPLKNKEKSE